MKESEQHLRIIYSKVKVGCFLPRLREVCRKWEEKGGKTGLIDQKANARLERVRRRNVGKTGSVDQKANARWERVRLQVLAQRRLFARQGAVVAGWRTYRNRRLGPYLRLAYREGGRQRSIYLGRCAELARRASQLVAGLQRHLRDRRLFARLKAQVRASLRLAKAELERALAPWGIRLQGFEFRGGVRKVMKAYVRGQGSGGWGLGAGIARDLVTTLCVVTRMPDALRARTGAARYGEGDPASRTGSVPAGRSHAKRKERGRVSLIVGLGRLW